MENLIINLNNGTTGNLIKSRSILVRKIQPHLTTTWSGYIMPGNSEKPWNRNCYSHWGRMFYCLRDMNVTEELGRPFTMSLELNSTENIQLEDLLGQNVTIRLTGLKAFVFLTAMLAVFHRLLIKADMLYIRLPCILVMVSDTNGRLSNISAANWSRILSSKCLRILVLLILKDKLGGSYSNVGLLAFNTVRRILICQLVWGAGGNLLLLYHEKTNTYSLWLWLLRMPGVIAGYQKFLTTRQIEVAVRDEECISNWYTSKQIQPGSYVLNEYKFTTPKADLKVGFQYSKMGTAALIRSLWLPWRIISSPMR